MGFKTRVSGLTQFTTAAPAPEPQRLAEMLQSCAFCSIDAGAEEFSTGWVCFDDCDKTVFSDQSFLRDNYACFSLRLDERKVSASLLRRHLDRACAEFLEQNPGFERVPKERKAELRDAVMLMLLKKTLPTLTLIDVVWNLQSGHVLVSSTSKKAIERVTDLFNRTFPQQRLLLYHPMAQALAVASADDQKKLQKSNKAQGDAIIEQCVANHWLGEDLLQWLVFRTVMSDSAYRVTADGPQSQGAGFTAFIDGKLNLSRSTCEGVQKVAVSGPQDNYGEAREALKQGKTIESATIVLETTEGAWRFNLQAQTFQMGSFRTPAILVERDEAEKNMALVAEFLEKMSVVEMGLQLFASLLADYLRVRLCEEWQRNIEQFNRWIEAGEQDARAA